MKTNEVNAIIEQCAQVAESHPVHEAYLGIRVQIAAAIRKLKIEKEIDPNIIHPGNGPGPFPEE